jgi:thiamine-phosphate pyrophosphorylase
MFPSEIRLYPLTDVRLSGLSHAEQVAMLIEGGVSLIQLREKHLSPREFYRQAEEAMRVARKRGVRIIINDRVDLGLALDADGVHLGQNDFPPEAARRLMGDQAIIGVSTHNVNQAIRAAKFPIDYLAIGPIYDTPSKENADPPVGLAGLRQVRQAVGNIKLIAIGGISPANALQVLEAGADAVAVISALLAHPAEIVARTKRLLSSLHSPP